VVRIATAKVREARDLQKDLYFGNNLRYKGLFSFLIIMPLKFN